MITVLLRRVVVLVSGALLVTGAVALGSVLGGLIGPNTLGIGGLQLDLSLLEPSLWTPVSAVGLCCGLGLLALSIWPRRRGLATISLPSSIADDGLVVRVALPTLEKLVRFEARQVNGVRNVTSSVASDEAGWRVHCDLVVWRGQSMRDVSEQVTERVRDALHRHTGVNLSNLEIDVALAPEPVTRVD